MKKILLTLALLATSLIAEVSDKWKINVGTMFVTNFESEIAFKPDGFPLTASINSKDTLGLEAETNVLKVDSYYRFNDKHMIEGSYFAIRSSGNKTSSQKIQWDDNTTIGANAALNSYLNMSIVKINYAYSFYHTDEVELAITAGLHITSIELGLKAEGNINNNGTVSLSYDTDTSMTVPLPTLGFKGQYTIIDKTLFVNYRTDIFFLAFDDYKGSLVTADLSLEYRFVEHVGVGVGFNTNQIDVEKKTDGNVVKFNNSIAGATLYLTYVY